jgi:tRNA uridine 5-carboxymethylaminomethyl modification enzyme
MYEPYIKRETVEIAKRKQYQTMVIPPILEIKGLPGLSKELQEKMLRVKPGTIAQAALIPGMTPAALALLVFKIKEIAKKVGFKQINKGINT